MTTANACLSRCAGMAGVLVVAACLTSTEAPTPAPVSSVTVAPGERLLPLGDTARFVATLQDASGEPLQDRAVAWSTSAPGIATVSESGLVTGVGLGTALVIARSEGRGDTAVVTVIPIPYALVVTTTTTGTDPDPNGYEADAVQYDNTEGNPGSNGRSAHVGPTDSVILSGLSSGFNHVRLDDVAPNCVVTGPDSVDLRSATVPARVAFTVACVPLTRLVVSAATAGVDQDTDGYLASYLVEDPGLGSVPVAAKIGTNDSLVFAGVPEGPNVVSLDSVAPNCAVAGGRSRAVDLIAHQTTAVRFAISCAALGSLTVSAATTGTDLDDRFVVEVTTSFGAVRDTLSPNGSVTFSGLSPGSHIVRLHDVAANCAVAGGADRTITIGPAAGAAVAYTVTCAAFGSIAVRVTTTGVSLDRDGYSAGGAGSPEQPPLPVNGSATLTRAAPGAGIVTLYGVAGNCGVAGGAQDSVVVVSGAVAAVSFTVTCEAPTQVAFVNGNGFIRFARTDAMGVTGQVPGREPAWSPDGARIAFVAGTGDLFVMNADGSGVQQLTTGPATDSYPAWSPDGTRIAFVSDRGGASQIHVMNADGSGMIRLATNAAALAPSWSPDGAQLAFVGPNGFGGSAILVMNADGSNLAAIVNGLAASTLPAWSPDGTRIAFLAADSVRIFVMRSDGSGLTPVGYGNTRPTWSPDGTRIAFGYDDCYGDLGCWPTLVIASVDGIIQEYVSDQGNRDPSWQPRRP